MNEEKYSYWLVQRLKDAKGLKTDTDAASYIDGMNQGNIANIKAAGKRYLTPEPCKLP